MATNSENSHLHRFGLCVAEGRREKNVEWGSRTMVKELMESGNFTVTKGPDSGTKRPVNQGQKFTCHISKLERVSENQNIWHDLCFIAGREELQEAKWTLGGGE